MQDLFIVNENKMNRYLFIGLLISNFAMAQQPTMKVWTEAWHKADTVLLKNVYSDNALIFPPNKPTVQGNNNILDFMKGGLGKVDVIFEAQNLIVSENLAFEFGVFKDVELSSQKVLAEGKYSVTWIFEKFVWKIQCHTWSMPVKF
jgi:ketosteroid isomerase-like protein